jgi:cell division protein FtsA
MAQILEPRVEEIFEMIKNELQRSGYQELVAAGIVLTGGSSLLDGMIELAEDIFDMPVRLGRPQGVGGLVDVVSSPMYSTGVGLILYGQRYRQSFLNTKSTKPNIFVRAWKRMRSWFGDTS